MTFSNERPRTPCSATISRRATPASKKTSRRRPLSRRWLRAFLGVLVLLFGLAMLHPYPRQSLFGPTIHGKPLCVWEDAVMRHLHRDMHEKTLTAKLLSWLGVKHEPTELRTL